MTNDTKFPPTLELPVTDEEASVVAPAVSPASVVAPDTSRVSLRVVAPVTPSEPPTVALLVTAADASVEAPAVSDVSVVAPVTSSKLNQR